MTNHHDREACEVTVPVAALLVVTEPADDSEPFYTIRWSSQLDAVALVNLVAQVTDALYGAVYDLIASHVARADELAAQLERAHAEVARLTARLAEPAMAEHSED